MVDFDWDEMHVFFGKLAGLSDWIDSIYEERDDAVFECRMAARNLLRKRMRAKHHEAMNRITPEETTWFDD